MILPIVAYGDPVLKKQTEAVTKDFPNLAQLISNMFKTMYDASGVGLAAPQIGQAIRLFVIDSTPMWEEEDESKGIKRVMINPEKVEEWGKSWSYAEGCLSIPGIVENVMRPSNVTISYLNENFEPQEETFSGLNARVIQHEYDHLEGILFVEYLKPLKRRLIRKKLDRISKGDVQARYKMKFPRRS